MQSSMWATKGTPAMPRIVPWDDDDKRWLARRVARSFRDIGLDAATADHKRAGLEMIEPLRRAIGELVAWAGPAKFREITRPSQAKWVVPMALEMLAAHQGRPGRFPADELTRNEPASIVRAATEPPRDSITRPRPPEPEPIREESVDPYLYDVDEVPLSRIELPEGWVMLPAEDWYRTVRLLDRRSRQNARMIEALDDRFDTLMDLIVDCLPGVLPAPENPAPSRSTDAPEGYPFVVVAGARDRDRAAIQAHFEAWPVELAFVDSLGRPPERVGACDWLIMMASVGKSWKKRARSLYQGRFSVLNTMAEVVSAIERLVDR